MWIMGTNPVVSMPNLDLIEAALQQLELVIVSDAYHPTDTSQYAHVLFPAAQWSEKEGVMTNSERRLTYLPKITEPPGDAWPDWQIAARIAQAMGFENAFAYRSAEEVFSEFKQLTRGRPCDYAGVSYHRLRQEGPLQWPVPTDDHPGTEQLYTSLDFNTSDGRANFIPVEHQEIDETPDETYPLILTTGHLKNQWHTMTRTGKSEILRTDCPEPFIELHLEDAERWHINADDMVKVISRRGIAIVQAKVSTKIRPGTCFMPFHWGRMTGYHKAANNVTTEVVDPISKQPELKACAVRVYPVAKLGRF